MYSVTIGKDNKRQVTIGVGETKSNLSFGLSPRESTVENELEKIKIAEKLGVDMVTDNTIGRREGLELFKKATKKSQLPVGGLAAYAAVNMMIQEDRHRYLEKEDFYRGASFIAEHGDFLEIHPTLTMDILEALKKSHRVLVSRAASIVATFMITQESENPFFEDFDEYLTLAKDAGIPLIIGNCLRPASIFESFDKFHMEEIELQAKLVRRAKDAGVPVMVEVLSHVHPQKINLCKVIKKRIKAPIGALGPLLCDVGLGIDHVVAAVSLLIMTPYVDWIAITTPAEHLDLPNKNDVLEGISAVLVTKHILNLLRGNKESFHKDREISNARAILDWEKVVKNSINPYLPRIQFAKSRKQGIPCKMCGPYCPLLFVREHIL